MDHPIHPRHMSKLMIIVILLSISLIVLIKPSVDNYLFQSKIKNLGFEPFEIVNKLDSFQTENLVLKNNATACREASINLISENEELKRSNMDLLNTNLNLKSDLKLKNMEIEKQIERLNQSYTQSLKENEFLVLNAKKDLENIKQNYEDLILSSARNICCKMRVDDPNINSYDVISNRIVCSSSGMFTLVC